ncbi:MAG: hypothetical protein IPN79_06450 [Saprospiraceae bacterium]|nr:hypothetical protein [Saprospiraceae bacterium]
MLGFRQNLIPFTLLFIVFAHISCRKDDPVWNLEKIPPKIKTIEVLDINSNSALVKIQVIHNGGSRLIEHGLCYNSTPNPTVSNSVKILSTETVGVILIRIVNITAGRKYYVRSFAQNEIGLAYGEELVFETKIGGNVVTVSSSNVSGSSAVLKGNLISSGSSTIKKRGFWVSEGIVPEENGIRFNHTSNILGEYEVTVTGLKLNTKYYYRAYVETDSGVSYGDIKDFTTKSETLPTVITVSAIKISATTFRCEGNVTSEGSSAVTQRGICYSTSQNPTINSTVVNATSAGLGTFTCNVDFFQPNGVTYYVRAFARNSVGVEYGNQVVYVASPCLPTLSTTSVSSITSNSAISGGTISNDGGSSITSRGVVWSTSQNPTVNLSTKTNNGSGSGSFTSNLTGLFPNTTYYLRAYATNSCGTSYGNQLSFQTSNSNFVGTITIGNDVYRDKTNDVPSTTPFGTYFSDVKHTYLIQRSEINNAGGMSGFIKRISFDVVSRSNIVINNFTIRMGLTNDNEIDRNTTYYFDKTYYYPTFNLINSNNGWNSFSFGSPFYWDGTQNLIFEICFDNVSSNLNSLVNSTKFYFTCNRLNATYNDSGCSLPWQYYSDFRPNVRLTFE